VPNVTVGSTPVSHHINGKDFIDNFLHVNILFCLFSSQWTMVATNLVLMQHWY